MKTTLAALALLSLASLPAAATELDISGSGTWANPVETSPYAAAGAGWSFNFLVNSNFGTNPASVADASYQLNGVTSSTAITGATFYDAPDGGLFDLNFADGHTVTLIGPDIGSTGTISNLGAVAAQIGLDGGPAEGSGSVTISAVPLPATLPLLGSAVAGLVAFARRRGA